MFSDKFQKNVTVLVQRIKGQMNQTFYIFLSLQYWCNVLNEDQINIF